MKRSRRKGSGRGGSPSSLTSALARVALATCCVLLASNENFGLSLWLLLVSLQVPNYRDQSREKGECQGMCLFETQMTLKKGNNNCYSSCKIKKKKRKNFRHAPPSPCSTSCMNFTHSFAGNGHHESPRTFRSNKPQASLLCCRTENILSILDEQHPLLSLKKKKLFMSPCFLLP